MSTQLSLLPATLDDREDIFIWRNDPATQSVSKNSNPIDWDVHVAWYAATLLAANRKIYIARQGTEKVGMIRFDRMQDPDETYLVSIVVAPDKRGRGRGKALLAAGLSSSPKAIYVAEIDRTNLASQRIFEACGFVRSLAPSGPLLQYRRPAF